MSPFVYSTCLNHLEPSLTYKYYRMHTGIYFVYKWLWTFCLSPLCIWESPGDTLFPLLCIMYFCCCGLNPNLPPHRSFRDGTCGHPRNAKVSSVVYEYRNCDLMRIQVKSIILCHLPLLNLRPSVPKYPSPLSVSFVQDFPVAQS